MSGTISKCLLLTLISLFILPSALSNVTSQGLSVVDLSPLDPPEAWATVTPSSIGTVRFSGTVEVTKPPIGMVTVQLDAQCDEGWSTEVEPETIPFSQSGEVPFEVEVAVPQATLYSETPRRLVVTAIATYPGGSDTAETEASVFVHQYIRLAPASNDPFMSGEPPLFNALAIYNRGNGPDVVGIRITNEEELKRQGIDVDLEVMTTPAIAPDAHHSVPITIDYEDLDPGIYYIDLEIWSETAKEKDITADSKRYVFAVQVKENPVVGAILVNWPSVVGLVMVISVIVVVLVVHRRRKARRRAEGPSKVKK